MIFTSTPYRISFFGGGTDFPEWYGKHGGSVLSTTINRYCHIQARILPPFFRHKHRIVWSKIETPDVIEDIEHPAVRALLRKFKFQKGIEIHHFGDLPARSGLGSSSSFTVGLLMALHGLKCNLVDKKNLAAEAIHTERNLISEVVGIQDQIATSHGGFNKIDIEKDGNFSVNRLIVSKSRLEELNQHLVLVYSGQERTSSDLAKQQVAVIDQKEKVLHKMAAMVDYATNIIYRDTDIREFGELLHQNWLLKKTITPSISNNHLDHLYEIGRNSGAIGGKILGAGGGGFMIFFVPPKLKEKLIAALQDFIVVPFKFEHYGAHVVYVSQNNTFPKN